MERCPRPDVGQGWGRRWSGSRVSTTSSTRAAGAHDRSGPLMQHEAASAANDRTRVAVFFINLRAEPDLKVRKDDDG